jgi:striatin 1/3/4
MHPLLHNLPLEMACFNYCLTRSNCCKPSKLPLAVALQEPVLPHSLLSFSLISGSTVDSNSHLPADVPLPGEQRLSIGGEPPAVPNGVAPTTNRTQAWKDNWSNAGSGGAALAKVPPPARDPRARARSRDYLKQCLLEVSYLTSPQAMNPLPNRPIVNNGSIPVLPNLPAFEPNALNGRPRKVVPDGGKEFPQLNGVGASGQQQSSLQQQQSQGGEPVKGDELADGTQTMFSAHTAPSTGTHEEPTQLTAIFRPDDAGEWKEKLRLANEAAERSMSLRQPGGSFGSGSSSGSSAGSAWDLADDGVPLLAEDEEPEDESALVDEGKKWRPKRTLRGYAGVPVLIYSVLTFVLVTLMLFGPSLSTPRRCA